MGTPNWQLVAEKAYRKNSTESIIKKEVVGHTLEEIDMLYSSRILNTFRILRHINVCISGYLFQILLHNH